jgi:hypothetical protein
MFRTIMMTVALAFVGAGTAAADGGTTQGDNWGCSNKAAIAGVQCVGVVAIFPITVDVKNVGVLSNNDLTVLKDSLNHVSILDGGILNHNKILNDLEVTVLDDFLNKFDIDITNNEVDVCTTVLGALVCK